MGAIRHPPDLLVLIRHPPTLAAPGVCYGRLDVPADERAPAFAAIRERVAALGPLAVWSSPAARCRALVTGEVRIDARLAEIDFGAWEGMRWDDIPRDQLDRWAADPLGFAAPGGESGAALVARVTAVFADICAVGEPAAVISHGGPLRVLRALAAGRAVDLRDPAPPLGSVEFFTRPEG